MRQLATVQAIKNIKPIEGADRIEQATVLGWHVVVQKGLHKEGDLVVYLEIDSVLPAELAEHAGFKDEYVKTRRFKGVYSQGLCLSVNQLPNPEGFREKGLIKEGTDLTEKLGITKWEPDINNTEKQHGTKSNKWYMRFRLGRWFWKRFLYKPVLGPFPSGLVPKTDETRAQVLEEVLHTFKGIVCQYTEKLDGSSITFWIDEKSKFHVCSRNREILDKKNFMYATASQYKYGLMHGMVYQGEILGPGIQGNKYGLKDYHIFVFQAYDTSIGGYISPRTLQSHLVAVGLDQVPVLGEFELTDDIDTLVDMSVGMSVLDKKYRTESTQREGIVVRPIIDVTGLDFDRFAGGRLSFKVVNPKFLVKYNL